MGVVEKAQALGEPALDDICGGLYVGNETRRSQTSPCAFKKTYSAHTIL